ncbi:NosD domain-containing protein [Methanotorris igneus]|nr:NosD domain-containing protein [Methanotorris igneus]
MKKYTGFVIGVLLLIIFQISYAENSDTYTLTIDSYKIKNIDNNSQLILIDGFNNGNSPGNPMLPYKQYDILLPLNCDLSSVKLEIVETEGCYINKTLNIPPAPPYVANIVNKTIISYGSNKNIKNGYNLDIYSVNKLYPSKPISIVHKGQLREAKLVRVVFTPVQYNPVEKKAYINKKVVFKISYNLLGTSSSTEKGYVMSPQTYKLLNNYNILNKNVLKETTLPNSNTNAIYDYVIVTTNDIVKYSSQLNNNNFVNYLKFKGYNPLIITEDDYGYETGQQRAINIRNWLRNHYLTYGIKYVLLIGNPDPDDPLNSSDSYGDIPMMMCYPRYGAGDDDEDCPTDYFYADLTGNWDSDGNGIYGDPNDTVDFYPEVFVGRIPVYNNDYGALDAILYKIMTYGNTYGDWRKNVMLPMAISNYENEDGYNRTDGRDLPKYLIENSLNQNGFSHYVMYERSGINPVPTTAPYYNAPINKSNVINEWNNGCGIVFWWGHGYHKIVYREIWVEDDGDGVPESNEMSWISFLNSYDTLKLNNDKPAITYQCSCSNGYPEDSDNLGYALLKRGAIATVSASRASWYKPGYWSPNGDPDNAEIGYEFVKRVVDGHPVGEALYLAKSSFRNNLDSCDIMNLMDFNLYGDPSLTINENSNYTPPNYYVINKLPYTIIQSGYYVLNTSCENLNTTAITIDADNVVLDGNGEVLDGYCADTYPTGIIVNGHKNITIKNLTVKEFWDGISLYSSSNNTITNVNASNNNHYGIRLDSSSNNTITNVNVSNNNDCGIFLDSSSNNTISNVNASNNNGSGIYLWDSSNNNTITDVIANNNKEGIRLVSSSNNTIYLNNLINNSENIGLYGSSNNTFHSPKPITYIYNGTNYTNYLGNYYSDYNGADSDKDGIGDTPYTIADGVYDQYPLIKPIENYIEVKYINKLPYKISQSGYYVLNTSCENLNTTAIIIDADNVVLDGNGKVLDGNHTKYTTPGICVEYYGIYIRNHKNITIKNLTVKEFYDGIFLWNSSNNIITNVSANNNNCGISLGSSSNNTITNNNFKNCGLDVYYSFNNTITNNTVNGKLLIYLENKENVVIDSSSNAGQVIAVNCKNITVKDVDLSNTTVGVEFLNVSKSKIINVNASNNNDCGIVLWISSNNTITNVNASNNEDGIVLLDSSDNNIIYLNNLINNSCNIEGWDSSNNILHSPEEITYIYNGNQYTNYLGNYYSDYNGTDNDGDGIGDTPYTKGGVYDQYPLINPVENYIIGNTTHETHEVKYINSLPYTITESGYYVLNTSCENLNTTAITIDADNVVLDGNGKVLDGDNTKYTIPGICVEYYGINITGHKNITIKNLTVKEFYEGIFLWNSSNNIITNVNASNNNDCGIHLGGSSNNNIITTVSANNNGWDGIHLYNSSNNIIYFNNLINNSENIGLWGSSSNNTFHSPKPITYTYNGNQYTNYLGNYYSDYNGNDSDGDGIGDTPYTNNGINDSYPLIKPVENYIIGNTTHETHEVKYINSLPYTINESGYYVLNTSCENLSGTAITIDADNVVLDGNGKVLDGVGKYNGIIVNGHKNVTIKNLTVKEFWRGICLDSSSNNTITNVNVDSNEDGIYLGSSSNNTITNVSASNNDWYGINLWISSNNTITNVNASDNNEYGILLYSSSNNTITDVIANNNIEGIHLDSSSNNNIITDVIANNNNESGIDLWISSNNTITNVSASNNEVGIYLDNSSNNNIIYLNNLINNKNSIMIRDSSNNTFHSPTPITYTYNGNQYTNYLGNYYSDYSGTDSNGDGIGDTPYTIADGVYDQYPLINPVKNYIIGNETTTTYIDLLGNLNYKIINETENATTFEITLTVTNNGNSNSGEFNTTIYINNNPVKTERLSLNAGESKEIKINYTTNSTNDIEIKAVIDTNNEVDEVDENNNIILKTIKFPDVGIAWTYIPTAVKINETKKLWFDLRKEGYGTVEANLTVKLDDKIIHNEKITFDEWYYDYIYKEIPITFNESGTHNITITITPIGTKDRNVADNTKTISVTVKEIKADIKEVYGLPYNNVLQADGEYWIDVYYNVSVPSYYTIKINTTKGIQIIGDSEKTRYTWRYGWTYFKIKAVDISNDENISIEIFDNNNKLLANKTLTGIKITDHPVEIKYSNITCTNSSANLTFMVFNTTKYDVDRHIEYMVMVGEQGRILKGIEYLAEYPHGCIEQTTSPMVASIYVKKYCEQNNISTNIDFDSMVNNGIERLTTGIRKPKVISNNEYAWGLWGSLYPKPIHTGYVLYGLTTANMSGYAVDMKYIENGARYLVHSQNSDGSWNTGYTYYMRDEFSSNALITISLAQTYNLTTNETLKQEIFNATNKSVRYLISQNIDKNNIYDLGFKAWALSEAYNMGINDSEVKDALNQTIKDIGNWINEHNNANVISLFRGTSSYSVYGVASESIAVASIGCQKAKDIIDNDEYITLNNMLINIYSRYGGSGWGSTKSTGLALRALTESGNATNTNNIQITVKVDGNKIDTITVNATNPKFIGKYYNNTLLTSGEHNITFEFSGDSKILCGVLMSQTTPYSIAIKSDGKDYIDPLAEDFNLTITTTKAIVGREFNATFTIINKDTEPIEVGILEIKLPKGMNYTNITKYMDLPYSIKFNSTTNETTLYIYPEIVNASSSLSITIPLNVTEENANDIEAVFYPMYNEETIAPAKATITVTPIRKMNIALPTGWTMDVEEKEDKTIITIK